MNGKDIDVLSGRSQIPPFEQRIEAITALGKAAQDGIDISGAVSALESIIGDPDYESVDYDLYNAAAEALTHQYINTQEWARVHFLLDMRAAVHSGALSSVSVAQTKGRLKSSAWRRPRTSATRGTWSCWSRTTT